MEARFCDGIDLKKQELRLSMERFGATKNGVMIAKALKEMVDTTGLEPATSTVSSSRPLTQKELITGGTRQNRNTRRNLLPNRYQKHGEWVRG